MIPKMIISHLFRRNFFSAALINKTKLVENAAYKRLLFKKGGHFFYEKRNFRAYAGDGKTVGFVINKKNSKVLTISHVKVEGFILASGAELVGSMIIFPHSLISWHVLSAGDVTEESLTLFKLLEPKIDILVFGYGSRNEYTPEIKQNFTQLCKKLGLRFEALPTDQAIGVYNFLADEGRLVAAALIPPKYIDKVKFEKPANYYLEDEKDEDEEELKAIINDTQDRKLIK